jgi:succinyl-diaminopimelate desuccinylase
MTKRIETRIEARLEQMQDWIVDLTCRLVAIPTENPPGRSYAELVNLLKAELEALDLPCEVIEVPGGGDFPRYILFSGFGSGPTLYLHGHYDVVLANHPDQFKPILQNGRIEGRGVADMKGPIAAMICAMHAIQAEKLNGRVEMVLVPDEETGGKLGAETLAREARFGRNGIGAIVGEPTGGVIWNASRGAITLRVRVKGKLTHVALQHEGRNAFEGALPILVALHELKASVEQRQTSFNIQPDAAKCSILMLGGEVSGGHQFNTVPAHFSFTIERRFNPEESLDTEKQRLLDMIKAAQPSWVDIEVEIIQLGDSSTAPVEGLLGQAIAGSYKQVIGKPPVFELCPGLLESRFYTQRGIPAFGFGPGSLSVSHGPEEYVQVQDLFDAARIYALTALRLLQGD